MQWKLSNSAALSVGGSGRDALVRQAGKEEGSCTALSVFRAEAFLPLYPVVSPLFVDSGLLLGPEPEELCV